MENEVSAGDRNTVNKVGEELSEFISKLRENVRKDQDSRTQWLQKLTTAANQRLGIKKYTRRPWPGAPNIPIPEADKQIRKRKPNFVLSVIGQGKPLNVNFGSSITNVTPELNEKRKRSELGINHVLMHDIDLLKTITIASDQFLEKGHTILKVFEDFDSELVHKIIDLDDFTDDEISTFKSLSLDEKKQFISELYFLDLEDESDIISDIISQFSSGKDIIEYDQEVITSFPMIKVRDAEKIIVPSYTTDIKDAERITDEFFLTARELMDRALSGAYNITKVKKAIEANVTTSDNNGVEVDVVTQQKNRNEGISSQIESEQFRVQEIYTWRPTGPKGKYERWVFTILPDVPDNNDATIQVIRFPYDFKSWNFVKHDNELKDSRYHSSRGIPEQIRAQQETMEKAINNILIRDQINNSPMFTVLSNSKIQPSTIQFIPGQRIQVNRHDEIQEMSSRTGKADLSSVNIFQLVKGFLEEYLGSTDQLFRNATNAGGGKTLGEIKAGIQLSQNLISVELMLFNESLKKVYEMVWAILKDRLGKPIVVNGVTITKDDFNFDAQLSPTGTIEALDKMDRLNRAFTRVNLVLQQVQLGLIATAEDLYNAFNDYLIEDGIKDTERYTTRPDVILNQNMQKSMQMQQLLAQQESELGSEIAQKQQSLPQEGGGQ